MKSLKKIFAVVLCLAMMASCFVMNASAITNFEYEITEDEFNLWVNVENVTGVQVQVNNPSSGTEEYVSLVKDTDYTLVPDVDTGTTTIKFTDSFLTKYVVPTVKGFKVFPGVGDAESLLCNLMNNTARGGYICSTILFAINSKQELNDYQVYLDFLVEKGALDINSDKKSYSISGKEVLTTDGTYVYPIDTNSCENVASYLLTLKDVESFCDEQYVPQYVMAMFGSYSILDFSDDVVNGKKTMAIYNEDGSYNLEGVAEYFSFALVENALVNSGKITYNYTTGDITDANDNVLMNFDLVGKSYVATFEEGLTEENNIYYEDEANDTYYAVIFVGPKITSGDNSKWEQGSKDNLVITSSAELIDFVDIYVDGANVPDDAYSVAKGSTIVTLNAAYLDTLSVGSHTLDIFSRTGTATATFTIEEAKKEETKVVEEEVADTADNSAIGAFVALGMFAAAGYVTLKKRED